MSWRKTRPKYTNKPHPGRTAIYQFRDKTTQEHLYVGISNHPARHFEQHAGLTGTLKKWWWDQADHQYVTITWYDTRRKAAKVQARLIRNLRPPGNMTTAPEWEKTATWRPLTPTPTPTPTLLAIIAMTVPLGAVLDAWAPNPAITATALIATLTVAYVTFKNINA